MNKIFKLVKFKEINHITDINTSIYLNRNFISIFGINDSGKTKVLEAINNFLQGKNLQNIDFFKISNEYKINLKDNPWIYLTSISVKINENEKTFDNFSLFLSSFEKKETEMIIFISKLLLCTYVGINTLNLLIDGKINENNSINQLLLYHENSFNEITKFLKLVGINDNINDLKFFDIYKKIGEQIKLKILENDLIYCSISNIDFIFYDIGRVINDSLFNFLFNKKTSLIKINSESKLNFEIDLKNVKDEIQYKYFEEKLNEASIKEIEKKISINEFLEMKNDDVYEEEYKNIRNTLSSLVSDDFMHILNSNLKGHNQKITLIGNKDFLYTFYIEYPNENYKEPLKNKSSGFLKIFNLLMNILVYSKYTNIILVDEPEANLHAGTQKELFKALNNIAENKNLTILVASHSHHFFDVENLSSSYLIERYNKNSKGKLHRYNEYGQYADDPLNLLLDNFNEEQNYREDDIYLKKMLLVEGRYDCIILKYFWSKYNENKFIFAGCKNKLFKVFKKCYLSIENLYVLVDLDDDQKIEDTKIYKDIKILKDNKKIQKFDIDNNLISFGKELESIIDRDELKKFIPLFLPEENEKFNKILEMEDEKAINFFIKKLFSNINYNKKVSKEIVKKYFPLTVKTINEKLKFLSD